MSIWKIRNYYVKYRMKGTSLNWKDKVATFLSDKGGFVDNEDPPKLGSIEEFKIIKLNTAQNRVLLIGKMECQNFRTM